MVLSKFLHSQLDCPIDMTYDTTWHHMTWHDTTRKDTKILYIIFLNTLKKLFWKFKFGIKGMYKKLIMSSITVRKGMIKKRNFWKKNIFFQKIFCVFLCHVVSCRVVSFTRHMCLIVSYRVISCHLDSLVHTKTKWEFPNQND